MGFFEFMDHRAKNFLTYILSILSILSILRRQSFFSNPVVNQTRIQISNDPERVLITKLCPFEDAR
jgi:hypothetical protein